jgi:hypothetical protein
MFLSSRSDHDEVATPKFMKLERRTTQKLRSRSPSAPEHN